MGVGSRRDDDGRGGGAGGATAGTAGAVVGGEAYFLHSVILFERGGRPLCSAGALRKEQFNDGGCLSPGFASISSGSGKKKSICEDSSSTKALAFTSLRGLLRHTRATSSSASRTSTHERTLPHTDLNPSWPTRCVFEPCRALPRAPSGNCFSLSPEETREKNNVTLLRFKSAGDGCAGATSSTFAGPLPCFEPVVTSTVTYGPFNSR